MIIKHILVWAILAMPTIIEAILDFRAHKKEQAKAKADPKYKPKGDNHKEDLKMRAALMIVAGIAVSLLDPGHAAWQGVILSLGIFVMFFDYLMGFLLTKNPFYLGETSQTDSWWAAIPLHGALLWRGILFVSAITAYYDLAKIISYN